MCSACCCLFYGKSIRWIEKRERGTSMSNLNFVDREILFLYKKFFGTRYPGDVGTPSPSEQIGAMTPPHVRAEKMCYALDLIQLPIGEYSYTWNYHGPYSPGLLAQLRELDEKVEDIAAFYDEDLSDDVAFTDADEPRSLFWKEDRERITEFLKVLNLPEKEQDAGEKMELVGSLAYISLNVLPGASYERTVAELMARKPKYAKEEMLGNIEDAWKILQELELVGVCA